MTYLKGLSNTITKDVRKETIMKVEFQKTAEDMKLMAIYIAQLKREHMEFQVDNNTSNYSVLITGF